jgi:L-threonylcarbamoyladenylate synthase
VAPPRKVNKTIIAHFRSIAEKIGKDDNISAHRDFENAILFIRSQREHKVGRFIVDSSFIDKKIQRLLERYNPLFDLTAEERIEATARRVGLNMPITHTI